MHVVGVAGVVDRHCVAPGPAPAGQHQQHLDNAHLVLNDLCERMPGLDVVDINEHPVDAKMRDQFVADGTRVPRRGVEGADQQAARAAPSRKSWRRYLWWMH